MWSRRRIYTVLTNTFRAAWLTEREQTEREKNQADRFCPWGLGEDLKERRKQGWKQQEERKERSWAARQCGRIRQAACSFLSGKDWIHVICITRAAGKDGAIFRCADCLGFGTKEEKRERWVMVFLPEDMEQPLQLNSFNPHRCKRVIWFLDTCQRTGICQDARATILMSINAAKQVVNVTVCKGLYDWTRCWPTEPENMLVFDVDSWIIKWTTLLLTQRLKSIISWACWTSPQEKHNFKVWHRKWKLYS